MTTNTRYLQVNMNGAWKDVCLFTDARATGDLVRRGAVYIVDCAEGNTRMRIVQKLDNGAIETVAHCHSGLGWTADAANDARFPI